MKVLIPTKVFDLHALAVATALEIRGHTAYRWFAADYPSRQTISFDIGNRDRNWRINDYRGELQDTEVDVVWLRRFAHSVPSNVLHADDRKMAAQENMAFLRSFIWAILKDAKWINPLSPRRFANSKLLQLQVAAKHQIAIPRTLVSNNADDIKKFISSCSDGAICKSLLGGSWVAGKDVTATTYTSAITTDQLPSDPFIQACPAIYQQKIQKAFEVRVTVMGKTAVAVAIYSQSIPEAMADWRVADCAELDLERIELPVHVYERCRQIMSDLGIYFGAFDFIVTPENDYVFLEVNEAGQFLWVEEQLPELRLLDAMTEFLTCADPSNFLWDEKAARLSLADVEKSERFIALWNSEKMHIDSERAESID